MSLPARRTAVFCVLLAGAYLSGAGLLAQAGANPLQPAPTAVQPPIPDDGTPREIYEAIIRLPLAAALGAVLALRLKRRGTPPRQPAVVQTQIMLAVVGAVIMIVVGASLARAFGIVGAANLIRYRSKIDDPKDAVVMLCALAVGLASGVGLFLLAIFATAFMTVALLVIESFGPHALKLFSLKVKLGKDSDKLRPKLERILGAAHLEYELRTSSDEEVCYDVKVPFDTQTDALSDRILKLDPEGHASVDWADKKAKA